MKIVAPMPTPKSGLNRVLESLHLWPNRDHLLLCLPETMDLTFLKSFETVVLQRNSGTNQPRCYLADMFREVMKRYPDEEWYGYCNSDCVPVGDIETDDHEAIIFHRTDIPEWEYLPNISGREIIPKEIEDQIFKMRDKGTSDQRIAKKLNRAEVPTPEGEGEWTYALLRKLLFEKGSVYFWGQDMFLFRKEVMPKVLEYIEEKDFIGGTSGFEQRLTRWCENNLKTTRVVNKIAHRAHTSEWTVDDMEYKHNGGAMVDEDRMDYINHTMQLDLAENKMGNWTPHIVKDPLTFITSEKMIADTNLLVSFMPHDIDAIVGIARSGLIPASMVACCLHLPLFSVSYDGVLECGSGYRFQNVSELKKILVVDDTVFAGRTMQKILPVLRDHFPKSTLIKSAIYVTPQAKHLVDYFACELPEPHYLEWNFFNAGPGERAAYDMDGILCHDIAAENDDDGSRYISALKNAIPQYMPRRNPIKMIVTARLERYREITMEWLDKHKVKVDKLVMGPWGSLAERNRPNEVATFKSDVYAKSNLKLFVESCPIQSKEICRQTGKKVLCPSAERVFS